MNIFVLDYHPKIAAQYHCDKHVVKMILESAQMLCTAHAHFNSIVDNAYKPTHVNHPCNIWTRECDKNYLWLWSLFYWLNKEYAFRYSKVHATGRKLLRNLMAIPDRIPITETVTDFVLAMPDEYKSSDVVASYRAYYKGEKAAIAKWQYSQVPNWW